MDVLYFYRHTGDTFGFATLFKPGLYAAWARKIWIYGDRPDFLTEDTSVAEHVSNTAADGFTASLFGYKSPVRNFS